MRVGERFGLGNTFLGMCYFKIRGRKLSSLQKQGREGVGGQWGLPVLGGHNHYSAPCRGEKGYSGAEIQDFFK